MDKISRSSDVSIFVIGWGRSTFLWTEISWVIVSLKILQFYTGARICSLPKELMKRKRKYVRKMSLSQFFYIRWNVEIIPTGIFFTVCFFGFWLFFATLMLANYCLFFMFVKSFSFYTVKSDLIIKFGTLFQRFNALSSDFMIVMFKGLQW